MSRRQTLQILLDAEHQRMAHLGRTAQTAAPSSGEPRLQRQRADAFAAALSQHLAAVDDVLLREAKHAIPAGADWMHFYVRHNRALEKSLHQLKAHLYGDATSTHATWNATWNELQELLDDHARVERTLVRELLAHAPHTDDDVLAERLRSATRRAPTRPHPFSPHTGLFGRLAHRFWRRADNFWDHAEGRVVPRTIAAPRDPDSVGHRYFTGAPVHRDG